MADWRQIQARIRKAKASGDAPAKLAELYEQTRDAMVAFELARWQEKAGEHAEAARWYTAAAERFRRSQWKSKAEAALARLKAPAPGAAEPLEHSDLPQPAADEAPAESESHPSSEIRNTDSSLVSSGLGAYETQAESDNIGNVEAVPDAGNQSHRTTAVRANAATPGGVAQDARGGRRPRRRGSRGGRSRRRGAQRPSSGTAVVQPRAQAETSHLQPPREMSPEVSVLPGQTVPETHAAAAAATDAGGSAVSWRGRSRAGEPALASRMAQLESQLRRLLACPQAPLGQAESAPAGPGVLLLSDSDSVTNYYVESCQTLRIAIGNLVRGGRGAKDLPRLKERMAENLGIAESRVTNYLKEHCAVRWLQLDEGANELAHFVIAVLRPVVNE